MGNQTIVVTGGTSGIGESCVRNLSQKGYKVVFCGRDIVAGERIMEKLENVFFYRADLQNISEVNEFCEYAIKKGEGKIYGLINNAGMTMRKKFKDTTIREWNEIFNVNTRSVYLMIHNLIDSLNSANGSVVTLSSVAGYRGEEGLSLYSSSKAALIGLTQSLALEMGHKTRFNVVCPGQIETRMMEKVLLDDKRVQEIIERIPVGRVGTPQDVAEMVEWLISSKSSFVNGSVIVLDGGESAGIRN